MGNGENLLKRHSRRAFNKSIAGALVTAPFAFSRASGQEHRMTEQDECKQTFTKYTVCPQLGDPQVPHEPPIIIGDGSLTMECDTKMHREASINNPPRKHRYEFEAYRYGTMLRLEVITEYEKLFTHECFPLGDMSTPKLKIWLQRLRGGAWVADDIDPRKTDAHLFITSAPLERFGRSFDSAVVETDKKFDAPKPGFKLGPTFKHKHKGYGSGTHFRIGRWKLIGDGGSVVHEAVVGTIPLPSDHSRLVKVLGFQLIPRFNHLERLLKCLSEERR